MLESSGQERARRSEITQRHECSPTVACNMGSPGVDWRGQQESGQPELVAQAKGSGSK